MGLMILASRSQVAMLSERLLITRIVTSLLLAILLLLGAIGLGHAGPAEPIDAIATVQVTDASIESSMSTGPTSTVASDDVGSTALLCAIGLFCSLVGLLLLRRSLRQPLRSTLTIGVRPVRTRTAMRFPPRPLSPSLTHLGISRT